MISAKAYEISPSVGPLGCKPDRSIVTAYGGVVSMVTHLMLAAFL